MAMGPGRFYILAADKQNLREIERSAPELQQKENTLHVLVNTAGATWGDDVDNYPVSNMSHRLYGDLHCLKGLGFHQALHPGRATLWKTASCMLARASEWTRRMEVFILLSSVL